MVLFLSCLHVCSSTGAYTAMLSGTYSFSVQKYGNNKQGSFNILVDNKQVLYTRHKDPTGTPRTITCNTQLGVFVCQRCPGGAQMRSHNESGFILSRA